MLEHKPTTSESPSDPKVDPAVMETIAVASGGPSGSIGARLGRYVIIDLLGTGGMGVVFSAFDPQLDRRVAIKVLKEGVGDQLDRQRLLREAKAMAKLTHANVVAVYDAGEAEGQAYVAMEFVRGSSLRRWLTIKHTWGEVVGLFGQAGRGLQAAHEAGLVHRDFKPDNVLVTESNVAKVADFGLARAGDSSTTDDFALMRADTLRATNVLLTKQGMLMGTPAYMSPEQYLSLEADARSDQFSFFVALYEALYGELPFEGQTLQALAAHVTSGHRRPIPPGNPVPRWIGDVIDRGLRPHSEDRWPTMAVALEALASDPEKRLRARRRMMVAVSVSVGMLIAVAIGIDSLVEHRAIALAEREKAVCQGGLAEISDIWGDEQRRRVRNALVGTKVNYALAVADRVETTLDEYRESWIAMYQAACLDHRSGATSGELLDLRMACLDQRRQDFGALVDLLVMADAGLVERASAAIGDLPQISACGDIAYVQARLRPPEDPSIAAEVEVLRDSLAGARALERAGRYDEALERLERGHAAVERVGYAPLLVEFDVQRGRLLAAKGDAAGAAVALEGAYYAARALGHDSEAILASTSIVPTLGNGLNDFAAAERWLRLAGAEIRNAGTPDQEADLLYATSAVRHARGDYAGALKDLETLLAKRSEAYGNAHPTVVDVLTSLGSTHFKLGHTGEAERYLEEARGLGEIVLGPEHPQMGQVLLRLGMVLSRERRFVSAASVIEQALQIYERSLGPEHPRVVEALLVFGELEIRRHGYTRAIALLERALAVTEALDGPEHPLMGPILGTLAGARYKDSGATEAVLELLGRALVHQEARLGPEHPNTAIFRANLGEVLNDRGQFHEARLKIEASLVALEKAFGPDRSESGPIHRELARALLGLGEIQQAESHARQALELYGRSAEVQPEEMAKILFMVAKTMVATGGDRAEARRKALEARGVLLDLGTETGQVTEIDAWLGEQKP